MEPTQAPFSTAATGGRSVCALLLISLNLLAGGARAELLGTHPHRSGTVHLMTDLCRADDPVSGQRAWQVVGGRERLGCWGVERPSNNPVVTWSDGSELVLDGDQVRLSGRTAAPLEERADLPPPNAPAEASTSVARQRAHILRADSPLRPSLPPAEGGDFARPDWCSDARFPHERLVCSDAELADRDLNLALLWGPYRRALSRDEEAWHRRDYFRRLKECGADKGCIVSEQDAQLRLYQDGLPGDD